MKKSNKIHARLNRHLHGNLGMGFVAGDDEVVHGQLVDVVRLPGDLEGGEGTRLTLDLLAQRLDVIAVYVRVAERVHEVARLQTSDMGNHVSEKSIRSDVEGHTQTHVGRSLVQLTRQLAIAHIKLTHSMTRWERHFLDLNWIPCTHHHASIIRIGTNSLDYV